MSLVTLEPLLAHAERKRYALPALNAYNLESTQAALQAAEWARSPLVLQYSHTVLTTYAPPESLAGLALPLIRSVRVPVALHYDHGKDLELFERCLRAGFTSGMLDGSHLPFQQNLTLSQRAADLARRHRATVELEVGRLAGREEWVRGERGEFTDPLEAGHFAELARPDALAVSIGSVHGQTQKRFHLDFDLLAELRARVQLPLVLHGSSGVPDSDLKRAVKLGIRKVNMNTQLRAAFTQGLRAFLAKNPHAYDPMNYLSAGREAMVKTAVQRMRVVGSAGKASVT